MFADNTKIVSKLREIVEHNKKLKQALSQHLLPMVGSANTMSVQAHSSPVMKEQSNKDQQISIDASDRQANRQYARTPSKSVTSVSALTRPDPNRGHSARSRRKLKLVNTFAIANPGQAAELYTTKGGVIGTANINSRIEPLQKGHEGYCSSDDEAISPHVQTVDLLSTLNLKRKPSREAESQIQMQNQKETAEQKSARFEALVKRSRYKKSGCQDDSPRELSPLDKLLTFRAVSKEIRKKAQLQAKQDDEKRLQISKLEEDIKRKLSLKQALRRSLRTHSHTDDGNCPSSDSSAKVIIRADTNDQKQSNQNQSNNSKSKSSEEHSSSFHIDSQQLFLSSQSRSDLNTLNSPKSSDRTEKTMEIDKEIEQERAKQIAIEFEIQQERQKLIKK
jgi:hypothetical protein